MSNYTINEAEIRPGEANAAAIMRRTPTATLKSMLTRMGVEYVEGMPAEVYLGAYLEEFQGNSSWILKMLPEDLLYFLVDIWENDRIAVSAEEWEDLQYLNVFGFLTVAKGNPLTDEPNVIRYAPDMKQDFYFHLKSRKSREYMERYTDWEMIISGLLYHYGLIELKDLHRCFTKVAQETIPFEEFVSFLKSRCTLWSFGVFLKTVKGEQEYFQYTNVDNPEFILMFQKEHGDINYKYPTREDAIFLAESGGVDNRWSGVTDLAQILGEEMNMDYYQVTVVVKSLIAMIQNGCEYRELQEKVQSIRFATKEQHEKALQAAAHLYEVVPLYELKGYSRREQHMLFAEKQLKKGNGMFRIIKGGKA